MAKFRLLLLPFLFVLLFITSCSDDDPVINEAQVLVEYLESTDSPLGKDYVNTDMPSIIKSTDVHSLNLMGDVYVIDIRSAGDYDTLGHIANAVNVAAGEVLTHIESVDLSAYQKVVVVCYSGQTAGWATSILRLMGYDNVYSMKWGMCSWNEKFAGSWNNNVSNSKVTQFTSDATDKAATGSLPALSTGFTTGQEILEARAEAVLAEGFAPVKVTNQAVFDSPANYYVVNYWSEAHYTNPGHIPGAMQYTPKSSIKFDVSLKTLPTDKKVAVYCYTGQTSAFMSAYLRILGYDAQSILFGANGMIYDKMVELDLTVWNDAQKHNYDYVKTGE